jgi:hypothetical protein
MTTRRGPFTYPMVRADGDGGDTMRSDENWRELIDGSFGDGPGHRPVTDRLVAGRRALRRRRIAVSAAMAVVAVGVGGAAWGVLPSEPRSGGSVVETPDDRSGQNDGGQVSGGVDLVVWTGDEWDVAPGWRVLDRVDNPVGYEPPKRSVGMELRKRSEHLFVLATYDGPCCAGETQMPAPSGTTLEEWLPAQVDNQRELDGEPVSKPVRFGEGETLVPADGVTIIDQVPHPNLPDNFATARYRTAAAWIEVNGKQRYVLVRELGGRSEIIPFTGSFPNLNRFLDYAAQQYAGGGGIR